MQHYVIELQFDELSADQLKQAWSKLQEQGVTNETIRAGGLPHLSLSSTTNSPVQAGNEFLSEAAAALNDVDIQFGERAFFSGEPRTHYLSVLPNKALSDLHRKISDELKRRGLENNEYYEPERIVLHTTLASESTPMSPSAIDWGEVSLPKVAKISRLAVVRYDPAVCEFECKVGK